LNTKSLRRSAYDASSYEWLRIIDIAKIIGDMTGATIRPGSIKGHDPAPAQNIGRLPQWLPQVELKDGIANMIVQARKNLTNVKTKS